MAGAEAGEVDTVQEGKSTVRTRQRLLERREERGVRLALHFVEDHSAFQLLWRAGVGRDKGAPETSMFRSRRHHGRDGRG